MSPSTSWLTRIAASSLTLALLISGPVAAEKQAEGGNKHPGKGHHQMMAKMDSDGDKRVSRDEFVNFQTARFDKMDSNGDHFIDAEERKAHHTKMKKKFKDAFERRQQELKSEQ